MDNSFKDYEELIAKFDPDGEEKFKIRFGYLRDQAEYHIKQIEHRDKSLPGTFIISDDICGDIILDYFADISRLKDFHSIERTAPHKVAAYTAYWVNRRKPIQQSKPIADELLKKYANIRYINETFAQTLLISMVYDKANYSTGDESWGRFTTFTRQLIYYFIYRVANPHALELSLEALAAKPNMPRLGQIPGSKSHP